MVVSSMGTKVMETTGWWQVSGTGIVTGTVLLFMITMLNGCASKPATDNASQGEAGQTTSTQEKTVKPATTPVPESAVKVEKKSQKKRVAKVSQDNQPKKTAKKHKKSKQ